jgi:hypothetical protein
MCALSFRAFYSGPFDKAHPVSTGQDSSLRHADEQAVLHHARHGGEIARQRRRIGDATQLRIKEPVPAIRDKSVAVPIAP